MTDSTVTTRTAREELYEIVRKEIPFERKAREALELGERYLEADNGHLTRIDQETDHWEAIVSTDTPDGTFPPGLELDLGTTYCRRTIEENSPIALTDAPNQGWADDPAFEAHGLHCYHGTPLIVDGEPYGTVCFVAEDPRERFSDGEMLFAELIAQLLERELEQRQHEADLTRQTNRSLVLNRVLRHNLRNNMSVIRGFTQLMADELQDSPYSELVLNNVDKLLDLSEKARELDQIAATDSERKPANIPELVRNVVETVTWDYPDASVTIESDDDVTAAVLPSFERALEELIENAAKHSGPAPTIVVSVATVPNAVEIRISDDGPGMPGHEADVLETGTETPMTHGSGLGLWLCHWIATSHGGSLEATVTDEGTTMALTIPRNTDSVLDRELTQLTRARDQYRAAFEEANDAILILNDEAQIIDANPEAGDLLGLEQRTLLGQSFQGFLLDTFDFDRAWNELQDAGSHRDYLTIVGCDGIEREVEYSATANIAPNQHLVVARDITERVERKRTLEETTRRLQAVIDASPDAIFAVDAEGTIQLWNEAAEDVFGYETEAVIGERIQSLELHTEGKATEFERKFERSLAGESFSELKLERRTKDGDPLYLSMSTAPIVDDSGTITGVMAVAKNVHTFREVVENTGSAIYWTDTDGTIEYVNPAFEAQTGYTADEAIGENACILQSGVYTEAFYERLWETILNGDVWSGQIINERKDGTRYTVKQTISPVTNEAGEIVRFVAVNEDITDLREAQNQLEEQRDNLETLSQVVRHDIRNDLQLVQTSAELAVEHVDEEGREYLETVQESTSSAVGLLRTARKLAELLLQTDVETRPIVLARPLEQQIDELQSLYPDAEIAVEGSLPRVRVVGNELLASVFRNLLQNAIQHNDKEVPSITVTTTTAEDLVEIRIADNGPGVPDTQKGMIFGKDEGRLESEGAGIGLYLVRSLVESYDGDVWVEDNEPEGAVFVVHLPVAGSMTHD